MRSSPPLASPAAPLLARRDHGEPSVFRPENLLREARRAVALDTADVSGRRWTPFTLAMVAARVGDHGTALDELEAGLPSVQPSVSTYWLRLDPWWAPLRDDPRFRRLLRAPR